MGHNTVSDGSQKEALQHLLAIIVMKHCIDPCQELLVCDLSILGVDLHDPNVAFECKAEQLECTWGNIPLHPYLQWGHALKIRVDIATNRCSMRPDAAVFLLYFFLI
jgi:hypothetical protein